MTEPLTDTMTDAISDSMTDRRTVLRRLLAAAMLPAAPAMAGAEERTGAQDFPNRSLRILVPLAPGGTADLLPRMVGEKLTLKWGQPVVVENRPGGALHVATEAVFRSEPDGYTLLLAPQGPLVLSPNLYRKLNYDPSAFVPVTVLATLPYVFVLHPKVPASTLQELVAYAKANPDRINYGTPATGSAQQLAIEWLKILAGVRMTHVPYRGAAQAMTDLLAGHVELMCDNSANVLTHVKEGRLKAVAIGALPRLPELPGVPAVGELYPGYTASSWFAIVAPPKTPAAIAAKLSAAIKESLHLPDVVARLHKVGATPVGSPPEETGTFIRQEAERWRKVIADAGITL